MVTALVLITLVGCTGRGRGPAVADPAERRIAGVPVLADHVQGPGTDLGNGFEVSEGTLLLGDVFPDTRPGQGVTPEAGWSAYLVVTGDATAVLTAYADQVEAAGYAPMAIQCRDDEEVQRCSGGGRSSPDKGESFTFEYQRAGSGPGGGPVSHLVLQYSKTTPTDTGVPGIAPAPTEVPPPLLPAFAPSWPALPAEGEPYEVDPLPRQPPPLTVLPGVELVAHPWFSECCGTPGSSQAVFRVTGDPRNVLSSYLEGRNGTRSERTEGDATVLVGRGNDGHSYDMEIVLRPGEPTYMSLTHVPMD